jgi:hypothetical protein
LRGADLRGARVAGVSTWDIALNETTRQEGLVLEEVGDFLEDLVDSDDVGIKNELIGRADHIEAVSLLYLIKDKQKFKTVIDAPADRDLIETVAVLAGLSCFVVADLTRPRSTPLETMLVAPQLAAPFASIIQSPEQPFTMFRTLQAKYEWMLPTFSYRSRKHLLDRLERAIVVPCRAMRRKLRLRKLARARG